MRELGLLRKPWKEATLQRKGLSCNTDDSTMAPTEGQGPGGPPNCFPEMQSYIEYCQAFENQGKCKGGSHMMSLGVFSMGSPCVGFRCSKSVTLWESSDTYKWDDGECFAGPVTSAPTETPPEDCQPEIQGWVDDCVANPGKCKMGDTQSDLKKRVGYNGVPCMAFFCYDVKKITTSNDKSSYGQGKCFNQGPTPAPTSPAPTPVKQLPDCQPYVADYVAFCEQNPGICQMGDTSEVLRRQLYISSIGDCYAFYCNSSKKFYNSWDSDRWDNGECFNDPQ